MKDIPSMFGSMVFNDRIMKKRLSKDVYETLKKTISTGKQLEIDVADKVAGALKTWAVEKGATHYTHWFQPMTGITAEKHDAFIVPGDNVNVIMEFSGKELVKGEPDASSFPSGGLRATFEARGYTAWDPTSYAFIKNNTLYIPTAFCSYSGEALDKKTPLLRSMQAIEKQALRIINLFGNEKVTRVISTVGPEQEYFLIDKDVWGKRPDLIYCGRTLFGARPPKGQEMEDHYFGSMKPRVLAFMQELEEELWKLGVYAKTRHNEVAPSQHELALIYSTTNIATDHNQLTMELMKSIANKHNLVCLLHEKPFAGVNGSGKHINWSLSTDTGVNLLEPGDTPHKNAQFLVFLTAVIKAVDEYQGLLRASVASAGNDHRLGANEAPPAIISLFLGDELTHVLEALANGLEYKDKKKCLLEVGARVIPPLPKDSTDRNRTSPFAFTGNKFEFRMPGSALSVAGPCVVLNTIVAESLEQFADTLEASQDFHQELNNLLKDNIVKHQRIVFNGNNYSANWVQEAKMRGLLNLKNTPEALPYLIHDKNVELFEKHGVFSKVEICSRYEILTESYCKTIHIEALTMIDLVRRDVISAILDYQSELIKSISLKNTLSETVSSKMEEKLLYKLVSLSDCLYIALENLENSVLDVNAYTEIREQARYCHEVIIDKMQRLRGIIDELESWVAKKHWPLPTYGELLYSV